jgi:hypothetical protein
MKRITWTFGIVVAAGVASAVAQPPAGRGGPAGGPGGLRPPMPLIDALDADHDHVISAAEIKNSSAALLTLDKNNDGRLSESEFGPAGGMGGGRGPNGPQGGGRGGGNTRRPGPGAQGGLGGQGGRGQGGRPEEGPPSPERIVAHAMEFDANNDGKLSKVELMKFAEEFGKHHPGPGENGTGPGANDADGSQRPKRPE